MQLMRFDGQAWNLMDGLMDGEVGSTKRD